MNPDWRPLPRPDVTVVDVDDDLVILDGDGRLHVLNPTAAAVWNQCDGARTVAGVVAALIAAYGAPAEPIGPEAVQLLDRLVRLGLVT